MVPPTSPSRGTPGRGLGNGSKLGERPAKRIRVQESRSSSNTDQEEELLIPIKRAGRTYGKAKKVTKDFKATATTLESTGPAHRSTTRTYGKASETISPRIHLTRKRIATTFTRSPTGPIDKVIAPGSTITPPLPMEEDSDNDEVVKQSLLGRRSAKKLAAADIYPSPSATPTRKLPAKQEKAGCRPTKGKKKMIIVSVEEEEEEKDEEIMEESSEVHEENTELEDAVEESEKLEQILEEASAEDSEEEYEAVEEEEESDDELDIRPPPSTSSTKSKNTPTKTTTPKKKSQSTTSPLRTPTTHRQDSESTTSRGSSNRIRSLPAAPIILTSQHQNLKAVLVGYHNDDGKLADGTDKDWDDDGEIIISPTKMRKDSFISTTHHSKSLFNELLQQLGQKLFSAHETLPEPEIPVEGFDENLIQDYPTLEGLEKWEKEVRYAIGGVVERGVGNCVVLLGPRGVGKSLIVERSIEIIAKVHGPDSFIPVRLNGLVQTTDRLVMKEIARQLKSQGAMDESGDFGSHSATMTTLLRLLEPPASENELQSSTNTTSDKPVVFILDEFDLFALHPRQSFLYCLLDIVQGNKRRAGVGVVGLSSRTDCLSTLEKRVRSRCQSQVLQICPENDLTAFVALARYFLRLDPILWKRKGKFESKFAIEWNQEIDAFLSDGPVELFFERLWKLHGNSTTILRATLSHLYQQLEWEIKNKELNKFQISRLSASYLPIAATPGRMNLVEGLTVLELSVCVAAKHLLPITDNVFNLEMLYDVYSQYLRSGKLSVSAKGFSKNAFAIALDRLRVLEIILPATGKSSSFVSPSIASNHKMWRLVLWSLTIEMEISSRSDVSQPLKRWCKRA